MRRTFMSKATWRGCRRPDLTVASISSPAVALLGLEGPRITVQVKSGNAIVDQPDLQTLIGSVQDTHAGHGLIVSWIHPCMDGNRDCRAEETRAAPAFASTILRTEARLWLKRLSMIPLLSPGPRSSEGPLPRAFREVVAENLPRSGDDLIVTCERKALHQESAGPISPLAAHDTETDRVLVTPPPAATRQPGFPSTGSTPRWRPGNPGPIERRIGRRPSSPASRDPHTS